jgi:hypothetical protein
MSDADNKKLYDDLEKEFQKLTEQEDKTPKDFGYLLNIPIILERPHLYGLRLKDGGYREVPHLGKVPPIPGLPVEIRYVNDDPTSDRDGYIFGTNQSEIKEFAQNSAYFTSVGPHSHHRGSGMEFPIDLRLIYQLSGRYAGDLTINITPGFYFFEGQHFWYPGSSIDMTPYKPVLVSHQKWTVIGLDRSDASIVVLEGDEYPSILAIDESYIDDIQFLSDDVVALFAVKLYQNRSRLHEFDFVAMYSIVGGGGGTGFDPDSILTSEGHVLTSDGNVLTVTL